MRGKNRSRRSRWLRWGVWAVGLALLLTAVAYEVLSLPVFGGVMQGERLARARSDPQFRGQAFESVEPQAPTTGATLWRYLGDQFLGNEVREPPSPVPVLTVDPARLLLPVQPSLRAFWIGHASAYVEIDGVRVLLDPVFSDHASPFSFGPKRFHPPPIRLNQLPRIDVVLISHDHYDHLDMSTIRHLAAQGSRFVVPLGIGAHLERWQVPAAQIVELQWWQEHTVGTLRIVCTPSRHYSGRGLSDYKATLWASWAMIGPRHRAWYSGDTGYSAQFVEIGRRLGPFDLGFVKIGAYGPGASWQDIHMTPEQAVQTFVDVRGRRMFPVHWGTFNLAFHRWDEPVERALDAATAARVDLLTPRIGEIVDADQPFESTRWWREVR